MTTMTLARMGAVVALTWGAAWATDFNPAVVNLEYTIRDLGEVAPHHVVVSPTEATSGEIWYGLIPRRLPGQTGRESFVPFAASYDGGSAVRAWCDTNFNGDLTDDPAVSLAAYPQIAAARSFLADLRWSATVDDEEVGVDWKLRVVLEPKGGKARPRFHLQRVFGMLGDVTLDGETHRAVLYDGNSDGLYSNGFPDGMFVDGDGDRHFIIDQMSPDFGPFGVSFQRGDRVYELTVSDPAGHRVTVSEGAAAEPLVYARIGGLAPDFSFVDTTGVERSLSDYRDRVVLIYFWKSSCGSCRRQAPHLRELAERYRGRGLEILGISYDTDRAVMEAFRREYDHDWPNGFTGLRFWENPIGRQYRAGGSGLIYLVSPDGRLNGRYADVGEVDARVGQYLGPVDVRTNTQEGQDTWFDVDDRASRAAAAPGHPAHR